MGAPSDAELVARCRAGDQAAWEALVDRYARYVHAIVARVYRLEPHDAEDAFQEVFARVFERLDTLRDSDAFRPWIAQTARNCAVDALRRSGREVPVAQVPDEAAPQVGDEDGGRLDAFGAERRLEIGDDELAEALVTLDPLEDRLELAARGRQLLRRIDPPHGRLGQGAQRLGDPFLGRHRLFPTFPPDGVGSGFLPGSSTPRSRERHRAIRLATVPAGTSSSAEIVR